MFQTQYLESLETALRAYNQGMYNNLWRIGEGAERALKMDSLVEAQQFAKGVAEYLKLLDTPLSRSVKNIHASSRSTNQRGNRATRA